MKLTKSYGIVILFSLICLWGCDKSFYPDVIDYEKIGRKLQVNITSPSDKKDVLTAQTILVEGTSFDKSGIRKVEVSVNGQNRVLAQGTEYWKVETLSLVVGKNLICARAINIDDMFTESCITVYKTFSRLADFPVAAFVAGCVGYNKDGQDKIYCMGGGNNPNGIVYNRLYEYDVANDSWIRLADMPEPRIAFGITLYQGKIYVIGGCYNIFMLYSAQYSPNNLVYDIAMDSWDVIPELGQPRVWPKAGVVNDKIYAFGGHTVDYLNFIPLQAHSTVEVLDPANVGAGWNMGGVGQLNEARTSFIGITYDNELYAVGGTYFLPDGSMAFLDSVEKMDNSTGQWEMLPSMQYPRWDALGGIAGGRIYMFGGENLSGRLSSQESFDLVGGDSWQQEADINLLLTANTVTSYKDSIYILSGSTEFGDGVTDHGKNYFYRYTPVAE